MSSTFCSEHLQVVLLLAFMAQWPGQHGAEETLQGDGGSPDWDRTCSKKLMAMDQYLLIPFLVG
jgi:hypothetical protein